MTKAVFSGENYSQLTLMRISKADTGEIHFITIRFPPRIYTTI